MTSDSPESEILSCAHSWLSTYPHILLFTIIETIGTSPRPAGSILIMNPSGEIMGSVSGGCIEEELINRRGEYFSLPGPTIIDYGIDQNQAAKASLPCGGIIKLLIEKLNDQKHISTIQEFIKKGLMICRHVDMDSGKVTLIESHDDEYDFHISNKQIFKQFGKRWKIILIGANQIAFYITILSQMLDYQIVINEPRKKYIQSWQHTDIKLDTRYPDEMLAAMEIDNHTIIITLSHDSLLDDRALIEALGTNAFYIGALGSNTTHSRRKARLVKSGITAEELSRLHAPTGIPIGSKTPVEIAISILAEITALRHQTKSTVSNSKSGVNN